MLAAFQNWLYFKAYKLIQYEDQEDRAQEFYGDIDYVQAICFADKYNVPELLMEIARDLGESMNEGHGMDSEALFYVQDHLPESSQVMIMIAEAIARFGIKDDGDGSMEFDLRPFLATMIAKTTIGFRGRQRKKNGQALSEKKMDLKKLLRPLEAATRRAGQDG